MEKSQLKLQKAHKFRIYDKVTECLVREVFFALSLSLGYKVLSSRASFPDFILLSRGETIRAEVETIASNFISHEHSIDDCDLIICFKNDLKSDFPLEVLELKEYIEIIKDSKETQKVFKIRGPDSKFFTPLSVIPNITVKKEVYKDLSEIRGNLIAEKKRNISFNEVVKELISSWKEIKKKLIVDYPYLEAAIKKVGSRENVEQIAIAELNRVIFNK